MPVAGLDNLKYYGILLSMLYLPLWAHLNKAVLKAVPPKIEIEKHESCIC